jgi:ribose transport system ATP-binding protein
MASNKPILRMVQIDKQFPGVHALDNVDLDLYAGEVHIVLGENGAGKSTLMKILSGSLPRDSGQIFIHDQEVQTLTPERSQALGIGMVYQELSLIPALSVAENIFLGQLPRNALGLVNWSEIYEKASQSLASLGVDIDPRAEVRQLGVAEQQLTEIARVLSKEPQILLLDEPTSALSGQERDQLFDAIRRLQALGVGIIYISHRLNEVPLIGKRVTVLRDGRRIDTIPVEEASEANLIPMMVGRELTEHFPKSEVAIGDPLLRVENLSLEDKLHDVSFTLHKGEILGVFGLMGAGQTELARALFGLEPDVSGQVFIADEAVHIQRPVDAIAHGMGYLTRDRRESLIPMQPIPPNLTLPNVSQLQPYQRLDLRGEADVAANYVRDLRIRPPTLSRPVFYLSGGNQQKVCLARWLCSGAKILIIDEPTRGIDVGAKAEVFGLIDDLTQQGVGVIMISSEMLEIIGMADRALVMRDGQITAEYPRSAINQENLLRSAVELHGETSG